MRVIPMTIQNDDYPKNGWNPLLPVLGFEMLSITKRILASFSRRLDVTNMNLQPFQSMATRKRSRKRGIWMN